MLRGLPKIVAIILFVFTHLEGHTSKDHKSILNLAKRSLLEREKEYIKNQPLSQELRSFIDRYKRKNDENRPKRSQNLEDSFYVIQNGQLVPVKAAAKSAKRNDEESNGNSDGFTVIPLVIPVNQQQNKLVKTRNLADAENIPLFGLQQPVAPRQAEPSATTTATSELTTVSTAVTASTPGNETEDSQNDEKAIKEETEVLHKILQDVEGLMQWKHDGNKKEGLLCNLNGSWISEAAGMRFDVVYQNATRKKFRIHVADSTPPKDDGFLCDGNWTVFGEIPFLHSGLVIVLAVHQKDKHLATFIGECRVCEGSETVTGTWLVGRSSRDCKDQKASHKILSDIWRREQGHTLRKKHLQLLGYKTKDED